MQRVVNNHNADQNPVKKLTPLSEKNWAYAVTTYQFVKRTCVYGAQNRREDAIRTGFFVNELVRRGREGADYFPDYEESIRWGANAALKYRAGNCSEQTALGIMYLSSLGIKQVHLIDMEGGDHVFAAIGLKDDSDLEKQLNIPPEAVVIDCWAGEIYLATEFSAKKQHVTDQYLTGLVKFNYLKGNAKLMWSFERDGLKINCKNKFIIEGLSIPEVELRDQGVIVGEENKPRKQGHDELISQIKEYKKGNKPAFFNKKNLNLPTTRRYANEQGFGFLLEKIADYVLAEHCIGEIPLEEITLDSVMPISRVPNFKISSLHPEIILQTSFIFKFKKMCNLNLILSRSGYKPDKVEAIFKKLFELVLELEAHIQAELNKVYDQEKHGDFETQSECESFSSLVRNCPETVRMIIDNRLDVRFSYLHSLLGDAVKTQNIDAIKILFLSKCIDMIVEYPSQHPFVLLAQLKPEKLAEVKLFIESFLHFDVNTKFRHGETLLHYAAKTNFSLIGPLFERRANPNVCDNDGWTPLHYAVKEGNEHAVRALLMNPDTDRNCKTRYGCPYTTPLLLAISNPEMAIVRILLADQKVDRNDMSCGWTPLIYAVKRSRGEVVNELLQDDQVDLNVQDQGGITALHTAVMYREFEMVKNLLANGSDPWICDKANRTPRDCAHRMDTKIIALLDEAMVKEQQVAFRP